MHIFEQSALFVFKTGQFRTDGKKPSNRQCTSAVNLNFMFAATEPLLTATKQDQVIFPGRAVNMIVRVGTENDGLTGQQDRV